jgi:hypothetical protein
LQRRQQDAAYEPDERQTHERRNEKSRTFGKYIGQTPGAKRFGHLCTKSHGGHDGQAKQYEIEKAEDETPAQSTDGKKTDDDQDGNVDGADIARDATWQIDHD